MGIFFPDNANRKTRVIELGSEAQNYLHQASVDYSTFQTLLTEVNSQIAAVYKDAGLKAPSVTPVEIISAADTGGEPLVADVSEIIADVAGLIATVKYLIPGATKFLVASGAMAEDTAARIFTQFTIPLIDKEVTVTLGDIAGSIVGGLVGGIAVAGIDLGIDAIEGKIAKDKLCKGIDQVFPLRAGTKLSQERAATLLDSLRAVKTTLDALEGAGVPLTDTLLKNLINRDVNPSVTKEKAITAKTVAAELKALDVANKSWTDDDPVN